MEQIRERPGLLGPSLVASYEILKEYALRRWEEDGGKTDQNRPCGTILLQKKKKTLRKLVVQGEVLQGGRFLTGDAM